MIRRLEINLKKIIHYDVRKSTTSGAAQRNQNNILFQSRNTANKKIENPIISKTQPESEWVVNLFSVSEKA